MNRSGYSLYSGIKTTAGTNMNIAVCIILLVLCETTCTQEITRRSPPDRNVFSRYANSRFPFFTVDLTRLQDKQRAGAGKRAAIDSQHTNPSGTVLEKDANEAVIDEPTSPDVAEAFGIFNAKHFGNLDLISEEFSGYEDAPVLPLETLQRSAEKRSDIRKRIHTCAFMRRMGVPIGLCFSNLRRLNKEKQGNNPVHNSVSARNPYDYLERQWQGHTMLGGGVGRR